MNVELSARHVLSTLLAVDVLLTVNHLVSHAFTGRAISLLDLNAEANIPAWWSSNQLLLAGLLLGLVAWRNLKRDWGAWSVGCLAILLCLLSLDEISGVHERIGFYIDRVVINRADTVFDRTGIWFIVLGVPFAAMISLVLFGARRFLEEIPRTSLYIGLGFAILLLGAVGMEALNNFFDLSIKFVVQAIEECFEMIGGSILLWASLVFACRHPSTAALRQLMVSSNHGRQM